MPARRKGEGTMMNTGFFPPRQASSTVREGNPWQRRGRGGGERGQREGGKEGGGKTVFALGDRKEKG